MSDKMDEAVTKETLETSPAVAGIMEALLGPNAERAHGFLGMLQDMQFREPSEPKTIADLQHGRENGKPNTYKVVSRRENMRVEFYGLTNNDKKKYGLHTLGKISDLEEEQLVELLSAKYVVPDLGKLTVGDLETFDHVTVLDLIETLGFHSRMRNRKAVTEGKEDAPS